MHEIIVRISFSPIFYACCLFIIYLGGQTVMHYLEYNEEAAPLLIEKGAKAFVFTNKLLTPTDTVEDSAILKLVDHQYVVTLIFFF